MCLWYGAVDTPDISAVPIHCGDGFFHRNAAPNEEKCSQATNLRLDQADITQLPYDTNSFDKVIAGNVLHLLPDSKKAMEEMRRVCRVGGEIIIPTYVKPEHKNLLTRSWLNLLRVVGVKFKNSFTFSTYQAFFSTLGYKEVRYLLVDGCPSCAIAFVKI